MTWQVVAAEQDRLYRHHGFYVFDSEPHGGGLTILKPTGVFHHIPQSEIDVSTERHHEEDDVWRVPTQALPPLHEYLGAHLGLVTGTVAFAALRRDYDAERERTDRLIEAVIERGRA